MSSHPEGSTYLLNALDRLRHGDEQARVDLIRYAQDRLQVLAHRMLKQFPTVGRWEQTDDVLQSALVRLHKALADTPPHDRLHFFRLSTLQIRRTLIDLARHYGGPEGLGAHHQSTAGWQGDSSAGEQLVADTSEPQNLDEWTAFHEAVAELPEEELKVFELLWYQGMSQQEAAEVLGVVERTVRRYWTAARLHLAEKLQGPV